MKFREHLIISLNIVQIFKDRASQFVIKVHSEIGEEISIGAFQYLSKHDYFGNSSWNRSRLKGYLLAYEFDAKGNSDIFRRRKIEASHLEKFDTEYQAQIDRFHTLLSENIATSNKSLKSHLDEMQEFKAGKEKLFTDWFVNSKGIFETFDKDSKEKVSALEELYEKKLQLKKPARYWNIKSKEYLRQATLMRNVLTVIVVIFGGFFAAILVIAPDWIFKTIFDGNLASIIRWSIVFITLVSLLAYVVKAITKVMFSSYHLARDAEERHTLTFFYLSLINDPKSTLNEKEREMVIQSLFSRTDTGLLKGDSSPEMPSSDVLNKLLGKS